jgi:hypothetical protein
MGNGPQQNEEDDSDDDESMILGDINYIEVNTRHVFLCGTHSLRVFSRTTGRCVLDVPSSLAPYGRWGFSISAEGDARAVNMAVVVEHDVVRRALPLPQTRIGDEFIASTFYFATPLGALEC